MRRGSPAGTRFSAKGADEQQCIPANGIFFFRLSFSFFPCCGCATFPFLSLASIALPVWRAPILFRQRGEGDGASFLAVRSKPRIQPVFGFSALGPPVCHTDHRHKVVVHLKNLPAYTSRPLLGDCPSTKSGFASLGSLRRESLVRLKTYQPASD